MQEDKTLAIEILNGAKDLDILKTIDPSKVEELALIFYKPVSLRFLKGFSNLKVLMISGSVKDYSPVSNCASLETLELTGGTIDSLDFIKPLAIKTLRLELVRSKVDTLIVPLLKSLENIVISKVSKIIDLSFLSDFEGLKTISLFELKSKKLFDFSKLKQLKAVSITNMFHLKTLTELKTIQQLEILSIHHFFINRQIKTDIKAELLKINKELSSIKVIRLKINQDEFTNADGSLA